MMEPPPPADPIWLVEEGGIDLFAVRIRGGTGRGPPQPVCRLAANTLVWGLRPPAGADGLAFWLRAEPGTRLRPVPAASLAGLVVPGEERCGVMPALDRWIAAISDGVVAHLPPPRRDPDRPIGIGERLVPAEGARIGSRRGVVWVRPDPGRVRYIDSVWLEADGDLLVPLTPRSWIEGAGGLVGLGTAAVIDGGDLAARMRLFLGWLALALEGGLEAAAGLESERIARRERQVAGATAWTLGGLVSVLDAAPPPPGAGGSADDMLFACCARVGEDLGIPLVVPGWAKAGRRPLRPLRIEDIAAASRVRVRQVMLRGRWWEQDHGPLIGGRAADSHPLALLSRGGRSYVVCDPAGGEETTLGEEGVDALSPVAHCLYPALPDGAVSATALLRFGLARCRGDLMSLLAIGSLGGLILTAIPLATGYVFDTVIPGHQTVQLLQLGMALLVAAFAATAVQYARDVARLRIESRAFGTVQAAVVDRLLRLPGSFFAAYSSGDLAQRVMAVEIIRNHLGAVVSGALVSGLFSLFNLVILFTYAPVVGAAAVALLLLLAVGVGLTARRVLAVTVAAAEISGRVSSLVQDLLGGIHKLRLAGAEGRAFNLWGGRFRDLQRQEVQASRLLNGFATFWAGYEVASLAAIFAVIAVLSGPTVSTGRFLVLITAFTSLMLAVGGLAQAVLGIVAVVPLYRRALPILRTPSERDERKADPGPLSGGFEVSAVCFSYAPGLPRILDAVSLSARPGEYIALVGASGSGKSTLLRLLLGFNQPESGGVFFDGRDLRSLDLPLVRRQIGVVLQHSRLMPGTIEENIRGGSRATLDECWAAAAKAGLEDEIRAMPMRMQTVLTEGAATLSGGQAQRILIAAAIVGNPRLLLFDEATSAIDNRTQAVVTESLDRLLVTRVVIAHRLSTIVRADRIFVLDRGRIVESGSYDALSAQGGMFTDLIRRQRL